MPKLTDLLGYRRLFGLCRGMTLEEVENKMGKGMIWDDHDLVEFGQLSLLLEGDRQHVNQFAIYPDFSVENIEIFGAQYSVKCVRNYEIVTKFLADQKIEFEYRNHTYDGDEYRSIRTRYDDYYHFSYSKSGELTTNKIFSVIL